MTAAAAAGATVACGPVVSARAASCEAATRRAARASALAADCSGAGAAEVAAAAVGVAVPDSPGRLVSTPETRFTTACAASDVAWAARLAAARSDSASSCAPECPLPETPADTVVWCEPDELGAPFSPGGLLWGGLPWSPVVVTGVHPPGRGRLHSGRSGTRLGFQS